jgi:hypothetical protein
VALLESFSFQRVFRSNVGRTTPDGTPKTPNRLHPLGRCFACSPEPPFGPLTVDTGLNWRGDCCCRLTCVTPALGAPSPRASYCARDGFNLAYFPPDTPKSSASATSSHSLSGFPVFRVWSELTSIPGHTFSQPRRLPLDRDAQAHESGNLDAKRIVEDFCIWTARLLQSITGSCTLQVVGRTPIRSMLSGRLDTSKRAAPRKKRHKHTREDPAPSCKLETGSGWGETEGHPIFSRGRVPFLSATYRLTQIFAWSVSKCKRTKSVWLLVQLQLFKHF